MKILVIFTGGTIGSVSGRKWISLDDSTNYTLIENYKKDGDDGVKFDVVSPYSILSENLSAEEITLLCEEVRKGVKKNYDGIIVTHGTDTIQYTAAALAYTVNAKNLPIVMVSANYPLEDERSNGNDNFKAAVDFIKSKKANGVFISYKNRGEERTQIHLATGAVGHAEALDEIFSLGGQPFATVTAGEVELCKNAQEFLPNEVDRKVQFVSSPKTLIINSNPGDEFVYNVEGLNAVLIKPYHSGTLNTESENLHKFCERAKDLGVPVLLCNVAGGKAYVSSKNYKDLQLTVLPFCTVPAIYMKVWLATSLKKDVTEFVINEIASEFFTIKDN